MEGSGCYGMMCGGEEEGEGYVEWRCMCVFVWGVGCRGRGREQREWGGM
jgi:hypothetical protein